MWLADRWKDYEVIDCSCGEKLERWSKYILLRPDPQVIWDTPKTNKNWKKLNGHYHRSKYLGVECAVVEDLVGKLSGRSSWSCLGNEEGRLRKLYVMGCLSQRYQYVPDSFCEPSSPVSPPFYVCFP